MDQIAIPLLCGFVADCPSVPVPIPVMPMRIVVVTTIRMPVGPVSIIRAITRVPPAVRHAAAPRVGMTPPAAAAPHLHDAWVGLRGAVLAPAKVVIDLAERLQCDARLIRVHTKAVV